MHLSFLLIFIYYGLALIHMHIITGTPAKLPCVPPPTLPLPSKTPK
jgi:hypothetical protein